MDSLLKTLTGFFSKTQTTIAQQKFEGIQDEKLLERLYEERLEQTAKSGNKMIIVTGAIVVIGLVLYFMLHKKAPLPTSVDLKQDAEQTTTSGDNTNTNSISI